MKTALEKQVQGQVPDGVKVKMNHILALNDSTVTLMAILDVSGNLGTVTGKRVFFPAAMFETKSKPIFTSEKRENPVDLQIPCHRAGRCARSLWRPASQWKACQKLSRPCLPLAPNTKASTAIPRAAINRYELLAVANTLFGTKEYPQLRSFYQDAATQDQQQVVLQRTSTTAVTSAPGKGK